MQPIPYPPSGASVKPVFLQFRDKDNVKHFVQIKVSDIVTLPSSTNAVTPLWKATRLVRHDLPLVRLCWLSLIASLFSMCFSTNSRGTRSILPDINVTLTSSLGLPFLFLFLEMGLHFPFYNQWELNLTTMTSHIWWIAASSATSLIPHTRGNLSVCSSKRAEGIRFCGC